MVKNTGSRIWWWIIPSVVILVGLGYYWYTKTGPGTEKALIAREISPDRKGDVSGGVQGRAAAGTGGRAATLEQRGPDGSVTEGPVSERFPIESKKASESSEVEARGPIEELFVKAESAPPAKQTVPGQGGYCNLIDQQVSDFFYALDRKAYFQRFKLEKDAYSYFAQIITKLSTHPPQPAGEGIQPTMLLANIYFFSRALEGKDLRVIKAVIENEGDTMEFNLETFYRWLMLGKDCTNSVKVRPTFDVSYRYAGFFLNTTGGRSYLFRRPLRLRILISYYCVLIVYQADRLGKNSYGLDIVPYLQPLKDEMAHHPEFEFQEQYISALTRVENYYLQKR